MDWSNEPYVRVYTRETDDDLMLSWDAQSVWRAMLVKFDRSGVIETRRGLRGLAALLRAPLEVVERGLPELLEDGRIVQTETGYLAPNFLEAQEARKSDKLRAKESRANRRSLAIGSSVTKRDASVTNRDGSSREIEHRHTASHGVTLTSADPDPDPLTAPARSACDVEREQAEPGDQDLGADLPPPQPAVDPRRAAHAQPQRAARRRALITAAWNYAATTHGKLKLEGLSPTSPPWSAVPAASYPPLVELTARVDELLVADDFAGAEEVLVRRVDVAAAVARRADVRHLDWFTPPRMWDGKSFAIDAALSPEQAARPRMAARAAPVEERVEPGRFKTL